MKPHYQLHVFYTLFDVIHICHLRNVIFFLLLHRLQKSVVTLHQIHIYQFVSHPVIEHKMDIYHFLLHLLYYLIPYLFPLSLRLLVFYPPPQIIECQQHIPVKLILFASCLKFSIQLFPQLSKFIENIYNFLLNRKRGNWD